MTQVRLSAAADADLDDILAYSIQTFGRAVAEEYLASFDRSLELLAQHPLAGILHTNIEPPIYSLSHRSHRIYYDVTDAGVIVQRVLHKAMNARQWLR